MAFDLGTARGKIELDAKGAVTGMAKAEAAKAGFFASVNKNRGALLGLTTAMGGTSLAIAGGFAMAIGASAKFEKQISAIAAVSGATEQELDQLREKALQLGADTSFSAAEAAGAIEELVKAGVSVTDTLNGAADATVALAEAGGVDMVTAATVAANALNTFHLAGKDLMGVADLIAGAANASAIDVGEFAMSLQQSGAVAQLAGASLQELTTYIALLGNAGIKGSDAGTSIKTFLNNLIPVTEKQIAVAKKLGLVTADNQNRFFNEKGEVKSLSQVAGILQKATKNLTREQKLQALETLFGTDAIRAAAVMADQGSKGFDKMTRSIGKVKAADVAAKRMDNLAGSFEQLKGSVETVLIKTGAPFQAVLRKMVDGLTAVVNAFGNLSPGIQKAISILGIFIASVTGIGAAVGGSIIFIAKMADAYVKLKKAMMASAVISKFVAAMKMVNRTMLANPILRVVTILIALGTALYVAYKKSASFRRFVKGLWSALKSGIGILSKVVSALVRFYKAGLLAMWNGLKKVGSWIKSNWKNIILVALTGPIGAAVLVFRKYGTQILAFFQGLGTAIWNFFKALPGRIAYAIGFIIGLFVRMVLGIFKAIGRLIVWLPGAFVRMMSAAVRAVARGVAAAVRWVAQLPEKIGSFISRSAAAIVRAVPRFFSAAASLGKKVLLGVVSFIKQLPGEMASFLKTTVGKIGQFFVSAFNAARNLGKKIYNGLKEFVTKCPGIVWDALKAILQKIWDFPGRMYEAAKDIGRKIWDGFKAGLGIGSPSLPERATTAMVENITKDMGRFKRQVGSIRRIAMGIPRVDLAGSSWTRSGPLGRSSAAGGASASPFQNCVFIGSPPASWENFVRGTAADVLAMGLESMDLAYAGQQRGGR